jgi:hypothetical protein
MAAIEFIEDITFKDLRALLSYDPLEGIFRWKISTGRWGHVPPGAVAGTIHKGSGYTQIRILGRTYYAHRLAWFYVKGAWPSKGLDHFNGKKSDNKLKNLREANQEQNLQNIRTAQSRNKTGFLGVLEYAPGKFRAAIGVKYKSLQKKGFTSAKEAHEAYLRAKKVHHPFQTIVK